MCRDMFILSAEHGSALANKLTGSFIALRTKSCSNRISAFRHMEHVCALPGLAVEESSIYHFGVGSDMRRQVSAVWGNLHWDTC